MEPNRRVRDRMYFVLLILGNIATALSGLTFDCFNDYDILMRCQFEAQNCTGYHMILKNNYSSKQEQCIFDQCDAGQCCCSIHNMMFVYGEHHITTVFKGNKTMGSKIIDIKNTVKPKAPIIVSVEESNGNVQVKWKTNYNDHFGDTLYSTVTYHIKGDTANVGAMSDALYKQTFPLKSISIKPSTLGGLYYYEITGKDLAPSTTYWVSVKSFTTWSKKFSDSSQEFEFTTPMSSNSLAVTIVISLCIAAIIISAALYGCCIKLKTKWLETAAKCPNPKLLPMRSSEQEVLKPAPLVISSVWVDSVDTEDSKWLEWSLKDPSCGSPLQSSGINTGSSCLSYANTEPADIIARVQDALGLAFPEIRPMSPLITNALTETNKDSGLPSTPYKPCDVRAEDTSVGSYSFDNETYSCLLPNFAHQIVMDCSDVKAEIPCDSEYLHNTSTMVPCVDKQALACPLFHLPPQDPSLMPIDMSYQQNNADSWGVSHAEDSSLSSVSSGTNTIASWDHVSGFKSDSEGFDEAIHDATKGPIICDENPSYGAVPAGLQSLPPVYDDYQPFQSLVEQPCYSFTEEKRGEEEDHLNKYPEETFPKMPQSFLGPVASGVINNVQCPPNLQRQLLAVIPADQSMPIITDSDYHSV